MTLSRRSRFFVWGLLALSAVGASVLGFFFHNKSDDIKVESMVSLASGSIQESVKVFGKVDSAGDQTLFFGVNNVAIRKISVREGQKVKAGEILAVLDTKAIDLSIRDQKLAVEGANISMDRLKRPAKEQDILQGEKTSLDSQEQVMLLGLKKVDLQTKSRQSIAGIDMRIADLESQISLLKTKSQVSLSGALYAQNKEEESLNQNRRSREQIVHRLLLINYSLAILVPQAMNDIDLIYGFDAYSDRREKNQIFVSGRSSALRSQVRAGYDKKIAILTEISRISSTKSSQSSQSWSDEDLSTLHADIDRIAYSLSQLIARSIEGVDASITDASFGESILSSYDAKLQPHLSNISSKISSLSSEKLAITQGVNNGILKENMAYNQMQTALSQGEMLANQEKIRSEIRLAKSEKIANQRQLQTSIAEIESQISVLNRGGKIAKSTLDDLLNGQDSQDIALQDNAIARSKNTLNKIIQERESYILRSSVDGIVEDIDIRVGDLSSLSKGIRISSPGAVSILAQVDQVDIVKIKPGNTAKIQFDAYPGEVFSGSLSTISGVPQDKNGVILYETTLVLQGDDRVFLGGMTAEVSIEWDKPRQIFTLPSRAIEQTDEAYTVGVASGSTTPTGIIPLSRIVRKNVVLGVTTQSGVEIISGLEMDEKVIIKSPPDSATKSSIFGRQPERDNSQNIRNIN